MTKITKEEFDRTAPHYCNCPCNKEIPWKEHFKYSGIPKFIRGHHTKTPENIIASSKRAKKHFKDNPDAKNNIGNIVRGKIPWNKGKKMDEEYSLRCSLATKGKKQSAEHVEKRLKTIISRYGKFPKKGKKATPETIKKLSESHLGKPSPKKGKPVSEETKEKLRQYCDEKASNWKGGISRLPYCNKWTKSKREEIRNKYDRKCFICNLDEKDNITKTGKIWRLSVHHIDGDKEQGCNDKPWFLVPLCMKCHGKTINKKTCEYWIKYIQDLMKYYVIQKFMEKFI